MAGKAREQRGNLLIPRQPWTAGETSRLYSRGEVRPGGPGQERQRR